MNQSPYTKQIEYIRQLAANPKALSLKDLMAARTEAQALVKTPDGYQSMSMHEHWQMLDAEYISRLTTFFPLLLEAATGYLTDDTLSGRRRYTTELSNVIKRANAPTQAPNPSFKVGDYVVLADGVPMSEISGAQQIIWVNALDGLLTIRDIPSQWAPHRFRMATSDEVCRYLIDLASKAGYVVGARVKHRDGLTLTIASIQVWLPGDSILAGRMSYNLRRALIDKPVVWVDAGAYASQLTDLTLIPEPIHYLYRVWMEKGGVVRRALYVKGPIDDLTKTTNQLNRDIDRFDGEGIYKVYDRQMPTHETI